MRRTLLLVGCLAVAVGPAAPASFYLTCDVPTELSGSMRLPWEVLRHDATGYSVVWALPPGTSVAAVHRLDGGSWLLAVAAATDLGGTTFEPREIVRFDGAVYTRFWSGAAAGVPAGSRIDALFLKGGDQGELVVSFDAVTVIGATTFAPADLARYTSSGWSKYFDAAAAGIPPTSNVTGADVHDGRTLLTFDVPTTVAGMTYLPGEIVSWDGSALTLYHQDPSWPISGRIDGVASLAHPGVVMESLRVTRSAVVPGGLTLSWSRSCSAGAEDYAIYEGRIGVWYSHRAIDCSDDGADRTEEVTPSSGDRYYLVVPTNDDDEGSYGTDSSDHERPRGAAPCAVSQELAQCPGEVSP